MPYLGRVKEYCLLHLRKGKLIASVPSNVRRETKKQKGSKRVLGLYCKTA